MYRKQDLNYLQNVFNRESNDIIIVYGKDKKALSDLYFEFVTDKDYFYYNVNEVESSLQSKIFANELSNKSILPPYVHDNFDSYFLAYLEDNISNKKVVIIDNFTFLLSNNPTIINYLLNTLTEKCAKGSVMFILSTTQYYWVENEMIELLGKNAYELSGIQKIDNCSFIDYINYYSFLSKNDVYMLYSSIGHRISLWDSLVKGDSYKSCLIRLLDDKNSILYHEGNKILPDELRNPTVYNTILYCIANKADKLGTIHEMCKIDKAKLSVYIKTLQNYNIIYKKESIIVGDENNIEKGYYAITDPFVNFWFHYIVPNFSVLLFSSGEKFYKEYIENSFTSYSEQYFVDYCKLLLEETQIASKLGLNIVNIEKYYDKTGIINLVITDSSNESILCKCSMSKIHMTFKNLEEIKNCAQKNKIKYSKILLISSNGFDQKLVMTRSVDDSLILLDKEFQLNHPTKNGVK